MIHQLDIGLAATADQHVAMFDLAEERPRRKVALRALDSDSCSVEINAHNALRVRGGRHRAGLSYYRSWVKHLLPRTTTAVCLLRY